MEWNANATLQVSSSGRQEWTTARYRYLVGGKPNKNTRHVFQEEGVLRSIIIFLS